MTATATKPTSSSTSTPSVIPLDAQAEVRIKAPIEKCFQSMLHTFGPGMTLPDGKPMNMKLETWPGGRWFRDLGDNAGHLWGHIQVIKPPKLLEITGPMFMSYAAISHVQMRLAETGDGQTTLTLRHQAIGADEDTRQGVTAGWSGMLQGVKDHAERH